MYNTYKHEYETITKQFILTKFHIYTELICDGDDWYDYTGQFDGTARKQTEHNSHKTKYIVKSAVYKPRTA